MLKRILIMLTILFISLNTVMAQDMSEILAMLEDSDALESMDISDFSEVLSSTEEVVLEDGTVTTLGASTQAALDEQIQIAVEEGTITAEVAAQTQEVVTAVKDAEVNDDSVVTLGAALEKAGTSLDEIEEAIVDAIAVMAVESLLSDPEASGDLLDGLQLLKGALGTLSKFGQANAQTSIANSLYGHQGYKLFAVSLGLTGSLASDMDTVNTIIKITDPSAEEDLMMDELKAGGFKAGISLQAVSASVGLNLSWLVDRLYVGAVFGSTNVSISPTNGLGINLFGSEAFAMTTEDLGVDQIVEFQLSGSINTNIFGITANYQLIKAVGIPILLRWNGLSLGTGLIRSGFNLNVKSDLSAMLASMAGGEGNMEIAPNTFVGEFAIVSDAWTIPLEISTGIRVLSMININLGAGADIKFGSSDVTFNLISAGEQTIGTKILLALMDDLFKKEDMTFPYSNPSNVELVNLKAMAGVGIGLGPISIDINAAAFVSPDFEQIGFSFGTNLVLRI